MREPTVLDYLKSRLTFGKGKLIARVELPPFDKPARSSNVTRPPVKPDRFVSIHPESEADASSGASGESVLTREEKVKPGVPWLAFGGLILALFAQYLLEPDHLNIRFAVDIYLVVAGLLIFAYRRREIRLAPLRPAAEVNDRPLRIEFLYFSLAFAILAFLTFSQDIFTEVNAILWLMAIILSMLAFWSDPLETFSGWWQQIPAVIKKINWRKAVPGIVLVMVICVAILFFRFSMLTQVPPEMVSDHAEKLLDVLDIQNGQAPVYFSRNTGREFFQFYWTALVIKIFNTGVTFYSLKLGTVLAGLLTLPYVYLLGKEYANRRVGLLAVLFTGLASWPNIISRLGLRFPFYPLFVAPALFYMLRGLRRHSRNDFIWAGLALGIGLHGYTSFRIVPLLIVVGFILFMLHRQTADARRKALTGLVVVTIISLAVFIPLLRYAVNHPEMFAYRTMTRVGSIEQPLQGPAWQIFFNNLWNAITMFNYSDGEIWVHSVTHRPALDLVSAALFIIGLVLLVVRYIHRRTWQDMFIVLAIPILMLPSILSLAFPSENPSLNRTAGAIIPVFLVMALGLESLISSIEAKLPGKLGKITGFIVTVLLIVLSAAQNYDLVFNQYYPHYQRSTWNTTEMGSVIKDFASHGGSLDSAWLVGYPYWVDSRVVGFTAGYPGHDYAIWPDQFNQTLAVHGPKLFLVNLQDTASIVQLSELYPTGELIEFHSSVDTKNFLIFKVP